MADADTQLLSADEKAGDNNGRNLVKPQTQEPYGDQELAAETKVTHERHFAGQPLETRADRNANEALRAERRERAKVDPAFRAAQKIELDDDEIDHDQDAFDPASPLVPLVSPVPDEVAEDDESDADDADPDDLSEAELDERTDPSRDEA
jgi:hypothetical protein